ncbi:MAG: HAMP domain-containing sensor histidine kinase [Campylobacterota bacterium]|nr:HAMP domain-containing sensor histidine kinase [Campylobacterota bacterium]
MLKIHHLFFIKFMGLFVGTILIASFMSYLALKDIVIINNETQLKKTINLLIIQLKYNKNLDVFANKVKEASGFRLTLIENNGLVIAESNYKRSEMENHATREEIIGARKSEYGIAIRYSNTLKEDFIYVAKAVSINDKKVFLRLSMSLEAVFDSFYIFWYRMAFAITFFILLSIIIPYQMSKKIRYDIEQITLYLEELSDKNYKAVLQTRYFSEFLQISVMLKDLAKKLHSRSRQKRKHTAKLRLINKQRNDILSAISHEFKNPVAAINGYAETLRDDLDTPKKIRNRFLEKIISNAMKISHMLDRLALSVKLENNDLSIKPHTFNLNDLINDIIENLEKKYSEQKIIFKGNSLHVSADKAMLELVLINLIDNALKYSQSDINIIIENDTLSVIDKGIGIKESELNSIVSKFYRVRKNTWDNSMGLGLAIVDYILKLHNLTLTITSKINEGSNFSFNIKSILIKK